MQAQPLPRYRRIDLTIARALGRALWRQRERWGFDVHGLAVALSAATYVLLWWWLSQAEGHPEWMWFLLGPGLGMLAGYIADAEPAGLVDEHVALTNLGADARWSVMRLAYPLIAVFLLLRAAASGEYSTAFVAVLGLEMALFVLIQYLLAIRVLEPDHPFLQRVRTMTEMFQAALANAAANDDDAPEPEPDAPDAAPDAPEPEPEAPDARPDRPAPQPA